ncbi:MAG: fumarylacetoacetate hydrolase family protein [Candidatus Latescibacterota bacterium]|jgi:2-keto-4-pentenoate hydratase/2-oxohepta-3-ene-1,7-dioic acid hydratase in catechol pathway
MRIYSLSKDDEDFLGFENDGVLLDLTRAIAFYEISKENYFGDSIRDIEDLIWDNIFTENYLGAVMNFVDAHGLKSDLTVTGEYEINPPINPGKIIALGNNYHNHIREMGQKIPDEPVLFGKWPSTVIGQGDSIVKPSWIGSLSYEAELAFIIGQTAKNVPASEAMEYVAGYTCVNDVTARDIQKKDLARSLPWMPSKNFDTFAPMGPCVLLASASKEPLEFGVQSRVNGQLKQDGNTRDLIFSIPIIIEYITKIMTLETGDVVSTGTPEGVGSLDPGDTVEITCTGIGTLSNTVVEQ